VAGRVERDEFRHRGSACESSTTDTSRIGISGEGKNGAMKRHMIAR
jgi:hypothetical protein